MSDEAATPTDPPTDPITEAQNVPPNVMGAILKVLREHQPDALCVSVLNGSPETGLSMTTLTVEGVSQEQAEALIVHAVTREAERETVQDAPQAEGLSKDAEYQQWVKSVNESLVPAMKDSAYVASLVPTREDVDAKFAVELGLAIMMDKPLLLVVPPGMEIPEKLRALADEIVTTDLTDADSHESVQERVMAFGDRIGDDGKIT